MILRTEGLSALGHPDFVLDCGRAPSDLCQPLLRWLEDSVRSGTRFRPGETVQYGAALLLVEEAPGGHLTLAEPAEGSMPVRWQPSVAQSVVTVARQRYVADSVGLGDVLDFVSPRAPAFVCRRAQPGRPLVFSRFEPLENGASWAAFCDDDDHDHDDGSEISMDSLYAIGNRVPLFRWMWALPVHTIVVARPGQRLQVEHREHAVEIEPGSFLDEFVVPD